MINAAAGLVDQDLFTAVMQGFDSLGQFRVSVCIIGRPAFQDHAIPGQVMLIHHTHHFHDIIIGDQFLQAAMPADKNAKQPFCR